jgi:hypothetical protein
MKIEDLKYRFDCVMAMPVGPFTRVEGQNLSLEMATIDQLIDRLGMLESLTNDIILYIEEKECHAYKPPLGLCVTCGRPRRQHTGEINVSLTDDRDSAV